jgi:hypothetical protein
MWLGPTTRPVTQPQVRSAQPAAVLAEFPISPKKGPR